MMATNHKRYLRHMGSYRRGIWVIAGLLFVCILGVFVDFAELAGPKSSWLAPYWQDAGPDVRPVWELLQDGSEAPELKSGGRILITGGGGNIGKLLVRRLLSSRNHITVLDLIFHQDEIDAIHRDIPSSRSLLRIVTGDIRDPQALHDALSHDIVGVIHLAAISRVGWCLENEPDCEDVNVRGTELVLEAVEAISKEIWFIQASSREVYGNAETIPVPEDAPNTPANAYGRTKADAEAVIRRHHLPAVLLRLSNVFGALADHRERLIPAIVSSALSHRTIQMVGGSQDLDMIHIDDVIHAFTLAIEQLQKGEGDTIEAYNVGTGTSASAVDIIQKVLALTNSSSPLQFIPGDNRFPDHYIGTTEKAAKDLGFVAKVGVEEGLIRLVAAFYQETITFLNSEIASTCTIKPTYGVSDLQALDGCSGSVGVDGPTGMEYLTAIQEEETLVESFDWVDTDEIQAWRIDIKTTEADHVVMTFSQTINGREVLYKTTDGKHLIGTESDFIAQVDPVTGFVRLSFVSTRKSFVPEHMASPGTSPETPQFRLTPFCCPGRPSPWPFYKQDPAASAISDTRLGQYRFFNASQVDTRCERLQKAKVVSEQRLSSLRKQSPPYDFHTKPLPDGQPYQWRVRGLDHCTNLCNHPTVCLDTGDCACAMNACVPRVRYPFTAYFNVTGLSYPPPTINWDEVETNDPLTLVRKVAQSSWLNVLHPQARRYLQVTPAWPRINLTRLPDDVQENRDVNWGDFNKLQSTPHGCFSADSVLERGVKDLSRDYTHDSLVFMPYFAGTQMMPPVEPWIENALAHNLPSDFDPSNLIIPFTFDWGVCNTVLHDLWRVRDWSRVSTQLERISSWQPMGDLNSPCYRIDQDIVIPARTCLQDQLRNRFGEIENVRPSRKRSTLVAFKGSFNGAGTAVRRKLACDRSVTAKPRLRGAERLGRYWNEFKPGSDYLDTIGDTIFCPVPGGTTGWATRTIDVVYAGCIPVLLGDQTHHPFWDVLDWTKFSIFIADSDIDRLEDILLSYSWVEVLALQANLVLIRDAFLYPQEPDMSPNLHDRGPFFFAMHSTALLRKTRFPVA